LHCPKAPLWSKPCRRGECFHATEFRWHPQDIPWLRPCRRGPGGISTLHSRNVESALPLECRLPQSSCASHSDSRAVAGHPRASSRLKVAFLRQKQRFKRLRKMIFRTFNLIIQNIDVAQPLTQIRKTTRRAWWICSDRPHGSATQPREKPKEL